MPALDWLGCATFRLTRDDLVVFLDAYMDRVASAPPTGMDTSKVDRADFVLVGHSHFDHLWGAEKIACAHFQESDEVCLGDLGVVHQDRLARLSSRGQERASLNEEVRQHLRAGQQGGRGDGGALVYRFEMPEGTLLYQDTCGYWPGVLPELQSDVAILAAAGRGNVAGEPMQGSLAQFVAQEVGLLQPRRVILGHHDDWLPGVSTAVDTAPIRAAIAETCPTAELAEMGYCAGFEVFR